MIGWFRKKISSSKTDLGVNPFELGKDYAQELIGIFEAYLSKRFDPVYEKYLDLLKNSIKNAINSKNAPAGAMARIQFELFIEQVGELKSEMTKELSLFLQGMLEDTSQMMPNAQEIFDELKTSMIEDFLHRLKADGVNALAECVVPLMDADAAWRQANPTLSHIFPEDDFFENLGSLRES